MRKGFAQLIILLGIVAIVSLIGGTYYFETHNKKLSNSNQPQDNAPRENLVTPTPLIKPNPSTITTAKNDNEEVEFKGLITTVYGDNFKDKAIIIYRISDGKKSFQLQTSAKIPNLAEFDRKEVQITGLKTANPNVLQVISIQVIQ